ncbi:MAG: transglycosylase SLT domain-containing protein [archaeon]
MASRYKKRGVVGVALLLVVIMLFTAGIATYLFNKVDSELIKKYAFVGHGGLLMNDGSDEIGKAIMAIDVAAENALAQSLLDLGLQGGADPRGPCGSFGGYVRWQDRERQCFNGDIQTGLERLMLPNLDRMTATYPGMVIPSSNYDIRFVGEVTAVGTALDPLTYAFGEDWYLSVPMPEDTDEILRRIYVDYGGAIETARKQDDDSIPAGLAIAVAAAASGGDPNYIGPYGEVGLFGISKQEAEEYGDEFSMIHDCRCQGRTCRVQPACEPGNDDRFDPVKSSHVGVKSLNELYDDLKGYGLNIHTYSDGEILTVAAKHLMPFGAKDIIKDAVSKDKNSHKNEMLYESETSYVPTWSSMRSFIEPRDLVTPDRTWARDELLTRTENFVRQVLAYRKRFYETHPEVAALELPRDIRPETTDSLIQGEIRANPSFRVSIDYDTSIYSGLSGFLREQDRGCNRDWVCWKDAAEKFEAEKKVELYIRADDGRLITGTDDKKQELKDWERYCEREEERMFNDVSALFQACLEANDDDCVCILDLDDKDRTGYDEDLSITIEEESGTYTFSAEKDKRTYAADLDMGDTSLLPQKIELDEDEAKIEALDKDGKKHTFKDQERIVLHKHADSFQIIEGQGDKLKLVDGTELPEDIAQCDTKGYAKVCMVDSEQKVRAFHPVDRSTAIRPVVIHASYFIQGLPPPNMTEYTVLDKLRGEESFLMVWDRPEMEGLDGYVVYYSLDPLGTYAPNGRTEDLYTEAEKQDSNVKRMVMSVDTFSTHDDEILDLSQLGSPGECEQSPELRNCYYRRNAYDPDKKLVKEELDPFILKPKSRHVWGDGKVTFVLDDLEDGKEYYVTLSVLDDLGREGSGFKQKSAISIDDFPPAPCSFTDGLLDAGELVYEDPDTGDVFLQCEIDDITDVDTLSFTFVFETDTGEIFKHTVEYVAPPSQPGQAPASNSYSVQDSLSGTKLIRMKVNPLDNTPDGAQSLTLKALENPSVFQLPNLFTKMEQDTSQFRNFDLSALEQQEANGQISGALDLPGQNSPSQDP